MLAFLNRTFTKLTDFPNFGKFLLRVVFACLMLFHGIAKIRHGINGIELLLQSRDLPGFIAYGVYIGEVVAPILILLGLFTRPAALIYSFNIFIAIMLVSADKFYTLTSTGAWGLELEIMFLMAGLSIMFLGSGSFSIMRNPDYR